MTILIVTLPWAPPSAAALCEGVLSDDGRTVLQPVEAPVNMLPAPSGAEIVAMVPASRLSWHRVSLPRGALKTGLFQETSAGRLRAVLDGLLEDSVLDDVSNLHFAIEPTARADAPVWVAACDRSWLHAWLATLAQAGRPAGRIVPELTPVSAEAPEESALYVTGTPDEAQLMRAGPDGVTVLPLSVATVALIAWPEESEVLAEPGVSGLAEQLFNRPVTLKTTAERWLEAAQSGWDLAQFDLLYNRSTRTRKRLSTMASSVLHAPRWRAARWATLALIAVNLVGLQAWAWKEQSSLAAQRSAIRKTLTDTFPEVRVVVDAPAQMGRALIDLQRRNGTASSGDMEFMLAQFHAAAPDLSEPSAIEFVAGQLRLKGLNPSADGLAAISSQLQAQGYSTQLEGDSLVMKEERLP